MSNSDWPSPLSARRDAVLLLMGTIGGLIVLGTVFSGKRAFEEAALGNMTVLAWTFAHYVLPRLQRSVVWYPARVLQYTIMVALTLVFLRLINQFIYFQF